MLLHSFLVWSGAQFSEQLWKLLFAGHGHQVALLELCPPCRKPPQEIRWTRLRHILYTPIWAQTETRWLRYILNDSDPNTVSTDQELVLKQFWVAEPDLTCQAVLIFPHVLYWGLKLQVRSSSSINASCCTVISDSMYSYSSLQNLVSRSTLRRQGKESIKEGNGIGVNSSNRLGINNFEFIRVLGKGSFGKVSLRSKCLGG